MPAALDGWHISRVAVDSVPRESRMSLSGDTLSLQLAGAGSLTVSATGCASRAKDDEGHEVLSAVGGDWAWGQWCALRGVFAFHGATLARGDVAIAVLGPPRTGCSLTALSLVRRGWRLIADGSCALVPMDSAAGPVAGLHAVPGRQSLQIDAMITTALPPAEPFRAAGTPRPRSSLTVPTAGPHRLTQIVVLQLSNLRQGGVVVAGDADPGAAARALRHTTVIGEALQWANPQLAAGLDDFCARTATAMPVDVALVPPGEGAQTFSPRQIADLIEENLRAERATP